MVAFAYGFLVVVNFVLTPWDDFAMSLKSIPMNSFPLSRLILSGQGHLFSHVCSTMSAMVTDCLSSHSAISNHPAAGSIFVTALKIKGLHSIFVGHFFSFCSSQIGGLLIAQGPIESAQSVFHGVTSAVFSGRCPRFLQ